MSEEMFLGVNGKLLINDFKPSYTITMNHSDGECVGRFDFNGPKLVFTGDAEESAKVFVNYLAMIWEKRLQEEREAEREACAEVCEEKQTYSMPIPCPDGIDGCCVAHVVPARREKTGSECAAAIRARSEK